MIQRSIFWLLFLTPQLVLMSLLLLAELLSFLARPFRRRFPCTPADSSGVSIVILNWNGRHLLEESLPALYHALAAASSAEHEVIVVDNGSEDDSTQWLRRNFPDVRLLELEENLGFGEGNNRGVAAASHDIVVLLNNDMIVEQGFLDALLEPFAQPDVFAVSGQILFPAGKRREETGNTTGHFRNGRFHLSHDPVRDCHVSRRFLPVLWAGGGSSAFRRDYFQQMGGFSNLFSPCYVEDTDLSYRAWRRGLRVLFTPESRVLHKHRSSSLRLFSQRRLERMVEERKLWYLWKNFQLSSLLGHFILYPLSFSKEVDPLAYIGALRRLPHCLLLRAREPLRTYRDRTILRWTSHPLSYLNAFFPYRHLASARTRKRVLSLSAYLPHLGRHGGAGRVFQLISRLGAAFELTLLSFIESREEVEEIRQVAPFCNEVRTVRRGVFESVSPFAYEPFEEFNCRDFEATLEDLLATKDFDLVHFEWTQMVQFEHLLPPVPRLLTEIEVNYAAHQSLVKVENNPAVKIRKYYNTLQTFYRELEMCRQVDGIVCVTESDADFLRGFVPESSLHVVPTGVDTTYFVPGTWNEVESNSLVYVGAFRHEPNVDAMLYFCRQVLPSVLQAHPKAHLYIVGSSPPPEIKALAAHPSITVTGFVDDLREYYNRAQVVIVPLRTGVGIRGKILEGWSAGKAMVATSLACLGIHARHGENILIADDPTEFALWTSALLRSPAHCRRLGQAGRNTALAHYEWNDLTSRLERVYESLAAGLESRA